jgi:hypothetical protein
LKSLLNCVSTLLKSLLNCKDPLLKPLLNCESTLLKSHFQVALERWEPLGPLLSPPPSPRAADDYAALPPPPRNGEVSPTPFRKSSSHCFSPLPYGYNLYRVLVKSEGYAYFF